MSSSGGTTYGALGTAASIGRTTLSERGTNAPRRRLGPDGRVAGVTDARPDVVVIGAGVAGLTAARELSRSGLSVLVLESSPVVGGKLRLGTVGGVEVDVGAESMLARRPEAVGLVAELGLDVVHPAAGSTQIWTRGALRPLPRTLLGVPLDLDALATTGVLSDDGLARARHETVLPLGDEDVSVAELLGSRLGHEVVDRLAEPMLGGVYAGHASTPVGRARPRRRSSPCCASTAPCWPPWRPCRRLLRRRPRCSPDWSAAWADCLWLSRRARVWRSAPRRPSAGWSARRRASG